ncbi:MAG: DUF3445 domain-containing protein [Gammaproteobacteria bacterium]|nr:DUF3445 domain-containing protein [Gammaproteobacteria bacterium]
MRLVTKVSPVYLPEPDQTSVLRLGLRKLPSPEWLLVDADFMQFYRNKLQLRENQSDKVFQALPGSEPAQRELQKLVIHHLANDHSNKYEVKHGSISQVESGLGWTLDDESLWSTSLWIQEDVCLMELQDDEYRLTAASVCAPSNWALEQKIGRSLDDIHQPVPGYARQLSSRVNRLFASLKPDKPLLRFNWSVQDSNELFWRKDLPQPEPRTGESGESGESGELYWRVERQTLRRLPISGAVVFTIRIFIHSFSRLASMPYFLSNSQHLIDRLSCDQKKYKGLMEFRKPAAGG